MIHVHLSSLTSACRHMDALSDCLSALETDPRYTRAYMKKADVLTAVGDYEGYASFLVSRSPSCAKQAELYIHQIFAFGFEYRRLSSSVIHAAAAEKRPQSSAGFASRPFACRPSFDKLMLFLTVFLSW